MFEKRVAKLNKNKEARISMKKIPAVVDNKFNDKVKEFNKETRAREFLESYNQEIAARDLEDADWEAFTQKEIRILLGVTEEEAFKLMKSGLFKVHRIGNEYRARKKTVLENKRAVTAMVRYQKKDTMTVMDMGRILGLGKTAAYRLIDKDYFRKLIIFGKIRVDVNSFEDWYAGQFHYKKINGEEPGSKYKHTMAPIMMAKMLGIPKSTAYDFMNHGQVKTVKINGKRRVLIKSFEEWYASQTKYKKLEEYVEVEEDDD